MKKSLLSHYIKSHLKEYKLSQKNGWFCSKNSLNIFANQLQKEKHDKDCSFCQSGKKIFEESISITGFNNIKEKMPEDKIYIEFPKFDFEVYIKKHNKNSYLKERSKKNIYDETYILY